MRLDCRVISVTRHEEWEHPRVLLYLYSWECSATIPWITDDVPEVGTFWTIVMERQARTGLREAL